MSHTVPDCCLKQQAYLVARGVRPIALIGHCPAVPLEMLKVATAIETVAEPTSIPFVVDRGDGTADYGYAAAQWVLDLYAWIVRESGETVPSAQRHRIIGLLLGYSVESIHQHEAHMSGRCFHAPSESVALDEPDANSPHLCSRNTGETYLPG